MNVRLPPAVFFFWALGWALCPPAAIAQQGITVQLPTFSFFSVATTVVVPDSGGAYMGGMGRGRAGRSRLGSGIGGQMAAGCDRQAAGLHLSARVHDLRGKDEPLCQGASPLVQGIAAAQPAATNAPLESLAELGRKRQLAENSQQAEAVDFLRRGREAQSAGKVSLARTYYQMALRRATGDLREQIAAQIEQLAAAPAPRAAKR